VTAGRSGRAAWKPGPALAAAVLLPVLAACGRGTSGVTRPAAAASATAGATGVNGRVGALQIRAARIPAPASPDVAAAYLTIVNTGSSPDALVAASTPAAASVSLHSTTQSAGGVEQMVPLASVPIPAHGTVTMAVGREHLMLAPTEALRAGDTVALTLVFRRAGTVRVQVPVVPLAGFGATPRASGSPGGMADMPGMG
jgi:copper(I)-binding protein